MIITVQASPGVSVPQEHHPHRQITNEAPVQVQDSPYYRRRMADGDLQQIRAVQDFPDITEHVALTDSHAQE